MFFTETMGKGLFLGTLIFLSLFFFREGREGFAAPLFFDPLSIEGVSVFRDSREANLYYCAPGPLILEEHGGRPLFRFTRIGYLGTARTQDQGVFRNRGVISFTVREDLPPEKLEAIGAVLKTRSTSPAKVERLPVRSMKAHLIYEGVTAAGTKESGTLTPIPMEEGTKGPPEERWRERSFVIALDDLNSAFFWKAFQADRMVLSLAYTFTVDGVDRKGDEEAPAFRDFSGALPLRVAPKDHPGLFEEIDLGGRMEVGYTHLDLYCFDFVNENAPGLYGKIVEVRYEDLRGMPVLTHVEFNSKKRNYKASIDFSYAKTLNKPYDFRVITINEEGERIAGGWVRDNTDSFLDVTTDTSKRDKNRAAENRGLL